MKAYDLYHTLIALSLLSLGSAAMAAPLSLQEKKPDDKQERMHRPPPPQAFEACKGKKLNEQIEFTTPRGEKIKAQCIESPQGLFARPDRPPRRGDDQREPGRPEKRQER